MFIFIETYRRQNGKSPTWSEIAAHMGWPDMDKLELRKVMRKGRSFGLKFELNKERSTRINGRVIPYIQDRLPRSKRAA